MGALDRIVAQAAPGVSETLTANVAATERLAAAIDRLAAAQERANKIATAGLKHGFGAR